jgi:cysteinyl-tRNA synthetase
MMASFDVDMNDDLSTAKVIATMFELAPIINGIKAGHVAANALSASTLALLQAKMKLYLVDIFGLRGDSAANNHLMDGVMQLLISIRGEARQRKDFATSDTIRNELGKLGIQLKDEKDGNVSYSVG